MSDNVKRVQSRKWLLTFNNPLEHGFSHAQIRDLLNRFRSLVYWCMCDEEGDECSTLHTHLYLVLRTPATAERINNVFPNVHRDKPYGKSAECRSYVLKDGEKFNKNQDGHYEYIDGSGASHVGTNYSDTFEEWGEMPLEHQGKSTDAERILELLKDGASNLEIVETVPSAMMNMEKVERTRSILRDSSFADSWRTLDVTYIFGATGVGKTRSVMDKYGYSNCYRVTDYKHPFDTYDGQDVLIFEEYRSQFKIADILNYLDGYPLLLPCRYFNRQACFTKVFIITNIPLESQYFGVAEESRKAFYRRIHKVIEHSSSSAREYSSVTEYLNRHSWVESVVSNTVDIEQIEF